MLLTLVCAVNTMHTACRASDFGVAVNAMHTACRASDFGVCSQCNAHTVCIGQVEAKKHVTFQLGLIRWRRVESGEGREGVVLCSLEDNILLTLS